MSLQSLSNNHPGLQSTGLYPNIDPPTDSTSTPWYPPGYPVRFHHLDPALFGSSPPVDDNAQGSEYPDPRNHEFLPSGISVPVVQPLPVTPEQMASPQMTLQQMHPPQMHPQHMVPQQMHPQHEPSRWTRISPFMPPPPGLHSEPPRLIRIPPPVPMNGLTPVPVHGGFIPPQAPRVYSPNQPPHQPTNPRIILSPHPIPNPNPVPHSTPPPRCPPTPTSKAQVLQSRRVLQLKRQHNPDYTAKKGRPYIYPQTKALQKRNARRREWYHSKKPKPTLTDRERKIKHREEYERVLERIEGVVGRKVDGEKMDVEEGEGEIGTGTGSEDESESDDEYVASQYIRRDDGVRRSTRARK